MHIRHVKVLLKYILWLMFLKFQNHICFHKINIGCNGTENNHTFSRACEPPTIVKLKILHKICSSSYSWLWNIQLNWIVCTYIVIKFDRTWCCNEDMVGTVNADTITSLSKESVRLRITMHTLWNLIFRLLTDSHALHSLKSSAGITMQNSSGNNIPKKQKNVHYHK